MTSPQKIEANRINAMRSTGPRSPVAKQRTSHNALKTGLYAGPRLLPGEDKDEYERVKAGVFERYEPNDVIEESVAFSIVGLIWRLRRLDLIEGETLQQAHDLEVRREIENIRIERLNAELDKSTLSDERRQSVQQELKSIYNPQQSLEDVLDWNAGGNSSRASEQKRDNDKLEAEALVRVAAQPSVTLRSAHIPRECKSPMEEISRMRRHTMRELYRDIAALQALQACAVNRADI